MKSEISKEGQASEYLMNLLKKSKVGDILPPSAVIARELGMSPTSVSYAVNSIIEMGYIESVPIENRPNFSIKKVSRVPDADVAAPKRPGPLLRRLEGQDVRGIAYSEGYRVTAYLYGLIEDMEPGDRTPAIREVADLLDVTQPSVQGAFRSLVKKGILEPVRPYGHFLVKKPEPDDPFFDTDVIEENIEALTKCLETLKLELEKAKARQKS